MTRKAHIKHVRTGVWVALSVALCAALIFVAVRHAHQEANWPQVPGSIQETRIVLEDWVQPVTGAIVDPHPVWKAEYKVAYRAAGQEYTTWSYSGIRGGTKRLVEIRMKQALTTPGFACSVKYNPARPAVSVADCE